MRAYTLFSPFSYLGFFGDNLIACIYWLLWYSQGVACLALQISQVSQLPNSTRRAIAMSNTGTGYDDVPLTKDIPSPLDECPLCGCGLPDKGRTRKCPNSTCQYTRGGKESVEAALRRLAAEGQPRAQAWFGTTPRSALGGPPGHPAGVSGRRHSTGSSRTVRDAELSAPPGADSTSSNPPEQQGGRPGAEGGGGMLATFKAWLTRPGDQPGQGPSTRLECIP